MPLFCICRGFQELNVVMGGTLETELQDIEGRLDHRAPQHDDVDVRYAPAHAINIRPGGMLEQILGKRETMVNSIHRQGIKRLAKGLQEIEEVYINGDMEHRVPHNLNVSFNYVEGESLIMAIKDIAVSSGSACTSASLEPSYVLRALGRSDELAHSSIRFTIGRFSTEADIDFAVKLIHDKIGKLRELSPLWDMFKEGIDINSIQWAAH